MDENKPSSNHAPSLNSEVTSKSGGGKVKIETAADLYKLPISVIKNTKLYDFEGKYYESIYEEALKIERSGGMSNLSVNTYLKKSIKIERIIFRMKYETRLGEDLGVIGSIGQLGNWDQENALIMKWTDGNIWVKEISISEGVDFEFKYIFIKNKKVQKWEDGDNRKFEYNAIKTQIENQIGGSDTITINPSPKTSLLFDNNFNTLTIVSNWNEK